MMLECGLGHMLQGDLRALFNKYGLELVPDDGVFVQRSWPNPPIPNSDGKWRPVEHWMLCVRVKNETEI